MLWRSLLRRQFFSDKLVSITYFEAATGKEHTVKAKEGQDLMHLAHEHDIDLEGACEGALACSTCHLILPTEHYARLASPSDEEMDMLDLAYGLTDTSRLGCQVKVDEQMEGMRVIIPAATRNMAVDGFKPKPH